MWLRSSAAADGGRCAATGARPRTRCRCDPRPPRTAAAASEMTVEQQREYWLRSSAAADGGRCCGLPVRPHPAGHVAILGRRGRRPLHSRRRGDPPNRECCDPRPPRTAAAAGRPYREWRKCHVVAILGRRGRRPLPSRRHRSARRSACCDPRPPQTAAAAAGLPRSCPSLLRLRSSAAADGGRCQRPEAVVTLPALPVAILGRRGRRPLPKRRCPLPRRAWRCDPRPPRTAAAAPEFSWQGGPTYRLRSSAAADGGRCPGARSAGSTTEEMLRSSAAADGGRCRRATSPPTARRPRCDPRPPRTAAAASSRSTSRSVAGSCCDPRPPRTAAAADATVHQPRRSPQSCDPRPPRTAAAARTAGPQPWVVRRCCDPRPPRTAAAASPRLA